MKINNNNKNAPKESAVIDSNYSFHSEGFIHRSEVDYLAQQIKQHYRKLLFDSSFHLSDLTLFSYSFTDSRDRTTISIKHTALQS